MIGGPVVLSCSWSKKFLLGACKMPKVGHHHVVHSAAHGRVMIANCCHFKDPQLVSSGGDYINLICVPNNGNLAKKHCEWLCKLWDPWYGVPSTMARLVSLFYVYKDCMCQSFRLHSWSLTEFADMTFTYWLSEQGSFSPEPGCSSYQLDKTGSSLA